MKRETRRKRRERKGNSNKIINWNVYFALKRNRSIWGNIRQYEPKKFMAKLAVQKGPKLSILSVYLLGFACWTTLVVPYLFACLAKLKKELFFLGRAANRPLDGPIHIVELLRKKLVTNKFIGNVN